MKFKEFLKNNIVYLDGGMGTLLFEKGLKPGEHPELWNITNPETIKDIHKSYYEAGSNVISTNTFGANTLKFDKSQLDKIIDAAIKNAKKAQIEANCNHDTFIALDIGPTGKLIKPYGDLDFEDAVEIFANTVKIGVKYGVDLIIIETMNDSYETKAALLAVKENCDLPVLVSNAYNDDGKLMTGASPSAMVSLLEGIGADAIGANCSLGPNKLKSVIEEMLSVASVPIILKPNAGLPKSVNGTTVFDIKPKEFAKEVANLTKKGVRIIGGCCGTTPEYIKELKAQTNSITPLPVTYKNETVVSSYTHTVKFGDSPLLIGERINPTGKKRFKQALLENDINYILTEGINQQQKGVHLLDVNVGLPDIDEASMLKSAVFELQAITDLPLQIDTSNINALESALRCYNGKALINSVNGKEESMHSIFPLVKKYGGVIVALTLDENGIPNTVEGRVNIANKILKVANTYGIDKKNIVFDTLAMTVSADTNAALITLKSLNIIRNELKCHTVLGVSNVSFGLPNRADVNSTFFTLALENGLSAAIMNPYSDEMMKAYYTYKVLKGLDKNCFEYISAAEKFITESKTVLPPKETTTVNAKSELQSSIIKGLKENAANLTKSLLQSNEPLSIVNNEIIPALNTVGEGFENKTVYLPQLLMSAEAAKAAFEIIKNSLKNDSNQSNNKYVILATVKGDIHDIGKNIVKLILENYGYNVYDLGKDVSPAEILNKAISLNASVVGLSALMTTTVPAMEETIKLIKEKLPNCKIMVGGAVLTKDYAQKIGADKYCKDAMEAVRYLENNL